VKQFVLLFAVTAMYSVAAAAAAVAVDNSNLLFAVHLAVDKDISVPLVQ